jgi:hypothetical protein
MGCVQINPKDEFEIQRIKFINKDRQIRNINNLINKKNTTHQYEYVKAKYEYSQQLPTLKIELHEEFKRLEDIFNEQDKKFMMNAKDKIIKSRYLESCRLKVNEYDLSNHDKVLYN